MSLSASSSTPPAPAGVLVAVTDHAVERYRQRIGTRVGLVDVRPEIVARVARAWAAGRRRASRPPARPDSAARST